MSIQWCSAVKYFLFFFFFFFFFKIKSRLNIITFHMYTMVDIDQPLFYRVLLAQSGIGLGVCRPPMG